MRGLAISCAGVRFSLPAAVLLLSACSSGPFPGTSVDRLPGSAEITPERIEADLLLLISSDFAGRMPGSAGQRVTADRIAARWEALGVRPRVDGGTTWIRRVSSPGAGGEVAVVVGWVEGRDPELQGEQIVVTSQGDPGGTAAMLAIVRALASEPAPRSVVFLCSAADGVGRTPLERLLAVVPPEELARTRAIVHLDRLTAPETGVSLAARGIGRSQVESLRDLLVRGGLAASLLGEPGAGIVPTVSIAADEQAPRRGDDIDIPALTALARATQGWIRWIARAR